MTTNYTNLKTVCDLKFPNNKPKVDSDVTGIFTTGTPQVVTQLDGPFQCSSI